MLRRISSEVVLILLLTMGFLALKLVQPVESLDPEYSSSMILMMELQMVGQSIQGLGVLLMENILLPLELQIALLL